jgi:hypothetical protein
VAAVDAIPNTESGSSVVTLDFFHDFVSPLVGRFYLFRRVRDLASYRLNAANNVRKLVVRRKASSFCRFCHFRDSAADVFGAHFIDFTL